MFIRVKVTLRFDWGLGEIFYIERKNLLFSWGRDWESVYKSGVEN